MLKKALDKFPPGTSKRWEAVQGYVRTRTVEEILDMVKHGLKAGARGGALCPWLTSPASQLASWPASAAGRLHAACCRGQ